LLTGNPEGHRRSFFAADSRRRRWNRKDYNSVIFFENGEIKETYRKQHLVPFTNIPVSEADALLYNLLLANDYNWWEKGNRPRMFKTDEGVTFSTPICFEMYSAT
jgi:apolipoprotein N-acyltransferase